MKAAKRQLLVLALPLFCLASMSSVVSPARAQVPPQPYLVIIPSGGAPDIAEEGSTVSAFGRNFCSLATCSAVTLTMGNEITGPLKIAAVAVQGDGTFTTTFTVEVPFPWRYIVTATQTGADGKPLTAIVPITVPVGDAREKIPPPPAIAPRAVPHSTITPRTIVSPVDAVTSPVDVEPRAVPHGVVGPRDSIGRNALRVGVPPRRPHPFRPLISTDPAVAEFPPSVAYDGRSVAVDVSQSNNAVAIAASESGGLFKTTDTGATWTHLDGLPTFRMSDAKMAPGNDQIVIATAWADSHAANSGGTWRSSDGGVTWQKPATADPTPGFGCPVLFNAWGISFAGSSSNDVFVGTDCGVSISHDLGATWTHVVPDLTSSNFAVYSINAQANGGGTIVDTCSADGHHRSTNGGSTWTPTSAALPACPFIGVHNIVASPLEPNVLFAAIDNNSVYESDNGGSTWTNLNPAQGASREPWVGTHLSADGSPNHFDIYFGSGLSVVRQTCTNTGGPGLRCSTSWNAVNLDHADQNGLAFSSSSNCAQYIVSDGGIHGTSDCGANWHIIGNGPGGYHALQVYEMNGQVHPGHTDLYFGTQDNNLWASGDNGATWPNFVNWEGFYIQTLHDSPADSGQTITFVACSGCGNFQSGAHFSSVANWNNPPGGGGNPFVIDQGVYIQWSAPSPPTNQLYLTTNGGSSWTAVTGASTTLQLIDHLFVTGPPANPVVYQEVTRSGGRTGLIKITGVRSGTATITDADTGLNNIGFWSMGQGTFRWAQVFTVDPNDPQHLIAADIGLNQMMVSTNGGTSWASNSQLNTLVTNFGQFQFGQPSTTFPGLTTEAHTIAFDPSNGNRVLVGTEQAGIMASLDGGATWSVLPGSEMIPAISSFFFDEVQNDVMASSYGRGLWKLDLTARPTTIIYTGDTSADFHDTANLSATLTDTNSGLPVGAVLITFTIGSQNCSATTDSSGHAACFIVLNQIPGSTTVVANFAGAGLEQPSQTSVPFTITKEETTLSYTGDTVIANGFTAHMSGVLLEDGLVPIVGRTVVFTLGTGVSAQTCPGITDPTGTASCTISPVNQPLGPGVVSDAFAGDAFYLPSSASAATLIFAFPARGVFVIGDNNSGNGANITFWSASWSRLNSLTGGAAPDSFKGFATSTSTTPPSCGGTWQARPGNSGHPPATLPSFMGVLVASSVTKSGSTISGDIPKIVVVKTNSGYAPNPGHAGTGIVVTSFCH